MSPLLQHTTIAVGARQQREGSTPRTVYSRSSPNAAASSKLPTRDPAAWAATAPLGESRARRARRVRPAPSADEGPAHLAGAEMPIFIPAACARAVGFPCYLSEWLTVRPNRRRSRLPAADPLSDILRDCGCPTARTAAASSPPVGISFAPHELARFHFVAAGPAGCTRRPPSGGRGSAPATWCSCARAATRWRTPPRAHAAAGRCRWRRIAERPTPCAPAARGRARHCLLQRAHRGAAAHPLLELMPPLLLLRGARAGDPTLRMLLDAMADEVAARRAGAATIMTRLADVASRGWCATGSRSTADVAGGGWRRRAIRRSAARSPPCTAARRRLERGALARRHGCRARCSRAPRGLGRRAAGALPHAAAHAPRHPLAARRPPRRRGGAARLGYDSGASFSRASSGPSGARRAPCGAGKWYHRYRQIWRYAGDQSQRTIGHEPPAGVPSLALAAVAAAAPDTLAAQRAGRGLLDAAIAAHGGAPRIEALGPLTIGFKGRRWLIGQSRSAVAPWGPEELVAVTSLDPDKQRVAQESDNVFPGGFLLRYRTVATKDGGWNINLDRNFEGAGIDRSVDPAANPRLGWRASCRRCCCSARATRGDPARGATAWSAYRGDGTTITLRFDPEQAAGRLRDRRDNATPGRRPGDHRLVGLARGARRARAADGARDPRRRAGARGPAHRRGRGVRGALHPAARLRRGACARAQGDQARARRGGRPPGRRQHRAGGGARRRAAGRRGAVELGADRDHHRAHQAEVRRSRSATVPFTHPHNDHNRRPAAAHRARRTSWSRRRSRRTSSRSPARRHLRARQALRRAARAAHRDLHGEKTLSGGGRTVRLFAIGPPATPRTRCWVLPKERSSTRATSHHPARGRWRRVRI